MSDFAILLAEMQADFVDELPDRCNRLEEGVMALEIRQAGAFDELYRQIHSLKGSGGMFGIPVITSICHQFESFISETNKRFDRLAGSTALAFVDLLRKTASPKGRDAAAVASIEQALERLRLSSLSGRVSVLLVEPSEALRKLYKDVFADKSIQLITMDRGMATLERMLHEPFDLLVASRELPDLNAIALVAALRESRSRNSHIPVILVSSNPAPVPPHLAIHAVVRRDQQLVPTLSCYVAEVLAKQRSQAMA
jgi:chemotaxis protein histidine kinase CheA